MGCTIKTTRQIFLYSTLLFFVFKMLAFEFFDSFGSSSIPTSSPLPHDSIPGKDKLETILSGEYNLSEKVTHPELVRKLLSTNYISKTNNTTLPCHFPISTEINEIMYELKYYLENWFRIEYYQEDAESYEILSQQLKVWFEHADTIVCGRIIELAQSILHLFPDLQNSTSTFHHGIPKNIIGLFQYITQQYYIETINMLVTLNQSDNKHFDLYYKIFKLVYMVR
jgi:hypothetical protein